MSLRNPLTMQGHIDRCWLFTFRTPAERARELLPPELEPVTRGEWAFWNAVICHIRRMRPAGVPSLLGLSYWHAAYRLYVRCRPRDAAPVEGLYFLRSDCDSPLIAAAGNALTDFRLQTASILHSVSGQETRLEVRSPSAPAYAVLDHLESPELAEGSPFGSLEEAAAFLKYQPCGISVSAPGVANLVRIQREEAAWRSKLIQVREAEWAFFREEPVVPEICYEVEPIDYVWRRGVDCPVVPPVQSVRRDAAGKG